ncbi:hypothetical protein [Kribbella sp. CA-294648]|uniref:hypothetical protein n=1 Tax=Kribbella sp. CA-294648 TaxID=3239948 RepID=UPI003D8C90EE
MTTDDFLTAVEAAGLGYDDGERVGLLMTMPVPVSAGGGNGGFLYVLICHGEEDEEVFSARLEELFRT